MLSSVIAWALAEVFYCNKISIKLKRQVREMDIGREKGIGPGRAEEAVEEPCRQKKWVCFSTSGSCLY
ncbi:hypothetical protein B2M23_09475 [Eubacterium limosum]|uniref:Uncharacterized protein n=1 Tax=Eubacterium limosum TaxID=1736 RepID=A0AAC9W3B6_EUBLI|nr:hypothetical protein B2M23_09475 [Eubacterium limosum]